ncbi:MAG: hypothetical protein II956_15260 [Bacteroidales bacterium]|nr:hypothetical protein [Bacteroidales bacterium]
MTAVQLTAALHRELSYIVTDYTMMERLLKLLRKMRKERKAEIALQAEKAAISGDTPEQVTESLKEGFKGLKLLKEGKIQARPIEDLFNELQD